MVAGKVKVAMGLQKSPANPKPKPVVVSSSKQQAQSPSPSSGKVPQKGAVFSRSFGVYFPRASAQVQPRPPDVAELLHLVEQLRERESRLKTELLEQKLLKESAAILPFLETEISRKDLEIEKHLKKIECLEAENERLRQEVEILHSKLSEQRREFEEREKSLGTEISDLKKALREMEDLSSSQRFQGLIDISGKSNLIKSLKRSSTLANFHLNHEITNSKETEIAERPKRCESLEMMAETSSENVINVVVRSKGPRVPKPPPKPAAFSSSPVVIPSPLSPSSSSVSSSCSSDSLASSEDRAMMTEPLVPPLASPPPPPPPLRVSSKTLPPPPPPPPSKGLKPVPAKVRRVPEVVEFYHSLMRRDSRRENGGGTASDAPSTANARDMIGEIENRSTHLLAIKTDVETQGEFIRFLIKEVENAAFTDIEDVVPFVKWLDDELSYLVDERAVLKHFEWPEQKADAMRETAFGYCDIKKLGTEASSFRDDPRQPCAHALKKMQGLFEKLEHGVYNLSRMRESASNRYKVMHIPMDWMLDTGYVVSQIKLASVKLAMKYMKRVSAELETVDGGPEEEELIVQGVRYAFRVHQFAGGFDVETMRAFQELRDKAISCHV